jgi:hypothetical protein
MIDIYLDIETIPSQCPEYRAKVRAGIKPPGNIKKPESIEAWLAENAEAETDAIIAKTSFSPARGHIVCIGWAVGDGAAQHTSLHRVEDEADFLAWTFKYIQDELPANPGMARFIGHYISGFDLRFIINRAIVLGVPIPKIIPRDIKPWSQDIFDTMVAWAGPKGIISLADLAEALGVEVDKDDFNGSMVHDAWQRGEYEKIARYCRDVDVETVRAIHRRFEAVSY